MVIYTCTGFRSDYGLYGAVAKLLPEHTLRRPFYNPCAACSSLATVSVIPKPTRARGITVNGRRKMMILLTVIILFCYSRRISTLWPSITVPWTSSVKLSGELSCGPFGSPLKSKTETLVCCSKTHNFLPAFVTCFIFSIISPHTQKKKKKKRRRTLGCIPI